MNGQATNFRTNLRLPTTPYFNGTPPKKNTAQKDGLKRASKRKHKLTHTFKNHQTRKELCIVEEQVFRYFL